MKSKIIYQLLLVVFVTGFWSCNSNHQKAKINNLISQKTDLVAQKSETDPDNNLLLGVWAQVGTPCFMKITGVNESGGLEMGYFNPKSINIVKSSWEKTGGNLSVFIQLQDDNYLNASFKLNYVPERDRLVGDFFETPEDNCSPVEFVRVK